MSVSEEPTRSRAARRRANVLDGKRWLQNSISVWSDIRKTAEESRLGHPALFPGMLVDRLIETFLPPEGEVVLDPFAGTGSTVLGAARAGKRGIGLELSPEYAAIANERLGAGGGSSVVHRASAVDLLEYVEPASVDLCITSPPYWDILNQRRTADMKSVRHYGNLRGDLGTVPDYEEFLESLASVFGDVATVLKPRAYCCVVVMDLRKKNCFYPLHSDLSRRLVEEGFIFDDLIIWNRQAEYNNLRPLGYPSVFRVNKVHEYIVILQKPAR